MSNKDKIKSFYDTLDKLAVSTKDIKRKGQVDAISLIKKQREEIKKANNFDELNELMFNTYSQLLKETVLDKNYDLTCELLLEINSEKLYQEWSNQLPKKYKEYLLTKRI